MPHLQDQTCTDKHYIQNTILLSLYFFQSLSSKKQLAVTGLSGWEIERI